MYKCTGCKKKTRAAKRLTIHTAPNVLVVHLKRFEHSGLGMSGGGGKIGRMVRFDTVLDLGAYMSERSGGGGEVKVEYELCGVLVHAGSTLYSGHYYSFVKAADGRWYEMNDSSVQRRTVEEVLAQKAYILFYTKKVIDTGVKGAAGAASSAVNGVGKAAKEVEREVERKLAVPVSGANGVVKEKGADELIKAMMKGKVSDGVHTPHLNGHSAKVAVDEKKEQPTERPVAEERKEEQRKKVVVPTQVQPAALSAAKVERAEEGKGAEAVDKREEMKEVQEEKEEKKVDGSRISLASTTILQTTVRISLLTPATSTSTPATHSSSSLLRQPSSPLSPPSALSSPTSSTGSSTSTSLKRKLTTSSSPSAAGLHPGMPSFRAGSQAKFNAFAVAAGVNGSAVKRVKREVVGSGTGAGVRLVPYSSSDDEEQLEERKTAQSSVPQAPAKVEEESKVERKEASLPLAPVEEKTSVSPVNPSTAPIQAANDELNSEPRHAENNDRKRRRLDVETATQSTAAPSTTAIRFDPHAGRHTKHAHYGSEVGTWEDDEKGAAGTDAERRERDEMLKRLDRERRGRSKDSYDVMYDEGKKRKLRGDKDEWRGVAVKSGENLLQREQERREGSRGDRRDERHRQDDRRHSDSRSRHSNGDRQHSSHHRHRDDRDSSRGHHRDIDRRHSTSHSSRRDSRDSHHSHRGRRDDDRDRSRHSWSHKR